MQKNKKFNLKLTKKDLLKLGGLFLGIYLITTAVSYGVFSFLGISGSSSITGKELTSVREQIEAEPKTEECILNGKYYSETEKNIWEARRPMGVMIENHPDARPLSGLSRADIVYEAVAEGGTTRFMGIFYCGASAESVALAPIRSSRVYFIDWVSEYAEKPLYVHFGGANNYCNYEADQATCMEDNTKQPGKIDPRVMAIEKLANLGWRYSKGNALDGGNNAGAPAIVRDCYRISDEGTAWEHCPVGSSDLLFDLGADNGFDGKNWDKDFTAWKFIDGAAVSTPDATEISFEFWPNKPDFDVTWKHDVETNSYLRFNKDEPVTDWEFDKPQIAANNVVIMFVDEETGIDEEGHVYYETLGTGEAMVFQNGTVIEGTWEKPTRAARTIFKDKFSKEIEFVRGPIWVEAIPTGNEIIFE